MKKESVADLCMQLPHQENVQLVFGIFDVFAETSKMPKTQRRDVFAKGGTCLPKTRTVFER